MISIFLKFVQSMIEICAKLRLCCCSLSYHNIDIWTNILSSVIQCKLQFVVHDAIEAIHVRIKNVLHWATFECFSNLKCTDTNMLN